MPFFFLCALKNNTPRSNSKVKKRSFFSAFLLFFLLFFFTLFFFFFSTFLLPLPLSRSSSSPPRVPALPLPPPPFPLSSSLFYPSTMSLAKDSNDLAASASNNSLYEAQYDHDLDHKDGEAPDADAPLTLRALVSTKEAGVIIGKAGKNVADLRDQTGVKAGVSKVVQGVHDRVLTVSGSIEGVAKVIISLFFIYPSDDPHKVPYVTPSPLLPLLHPRRSICSLEQPKKKAVAILSLVYFCFLTIHTNRNSWTGQE